MSSVGAVFSIAKDALATQRSSVDVIAHNIANVDTPGYSRQRPVHQTKDAITLGTVHFGRGVELTQVRRISDQYLEDQLFQEKSSLSSNTQMETNMQALEGIFNESSGASVSGMISDFWNSWHDLANEPAASAPRNVLYEKSLLLTERLASIDADMASLDRALDNAVVVGVEDINRITGEIAQINGQIISAEIHSQANDLRDKRNSLVTDLAQQIGVQVFEQPNGAMTVLTAKGLTLVDGGSNYELTVNGSAIDWEGSGGSAIDIAGYIEKGKLGGLLTTRDEVVAKLELDFDSMTKQFIWLVNQQHSQGVGLEGFSSATGTYVPVDSAEELATADSGLTFYDEIASGAFNLWVYDSSGNVVGGAPASIAINSATTTLDSLAAAIDAVSNISSSVDSSGALQISAASGYTFAFSNDTSNVLAALGINTFFTGSEAGTINVSSKIGNNKDYITAARVDNTSTSSTYGTFGIGDNSNARAMADLQYSSTDIPQWMVDRIDGNTEGSTNATIEEYYNSFVASVGVKSASATRGVEFGKAMVSRLGQARDSVSAVSLDEEMAALIQYQQSYAAAAKLLSTADEMLDTLIKTT